MARNLLPYWHRLNKTEREFIIHTLTFLADPPRRDLRQDGWPLPNALLDLDYVIKEQLASDYRSDREIGRKLREWSKEEPKDGNGNQEQG